MDEVRPIDGWPGYEVSADGRVFSELRRNRIEMKQRLNGVGYPAICLRRDGTRKYMAVHRLVAIAFLPPRPTPAHEIRHLNGERTDNRAENLMWGTRKENAADRKAHGHTLRGRDIPEAERKRRSEVAIRIGLPYLGQAARRRRKELSA